MMARSLAVAIVVLTVSCGQAGPRGGGATPSPTLRSTMTPPALAQYDAQLLSDLKALDFQVYETPTRLGRYVFSGGGLDYDHKIFEAQYGGLAITEWKALAFDPATGRCSTSDPRYAWPCVYRTTSPKGHAIFVATDSAEAYFELGSTVVKVQGATTKIPTLSDVEMFADALTPATPEEVVRRNQEARDYATYLQQTVASRLDFKTYLPQQPLLNFVLDRKFLGNPADPLHPYLNLHFQRTAVGNEAFEFTVDEFRDDLPLAPTHCGPLNPEIELLSPRCMQWFTTAGGLAVYTTYDSTRFERWPTRIVVDYSPAIHGATKAQMEPFIDSFVEVPPASIQPA